MTAPLRHDRLINIKHGVLRMALILFTALLSSATAQAAEPEAEWETVTKPTFSFSIPKTLKKNSVQGFEGMIERYEGEGIKLWFDYGRNPDNLEHWPKGAVVENVKVGEDAGRLATHNRVDPKVNSTSSVALYVRRPDEPLALGMYTWCDNEKAIALAKKILLTVRLAPAEAKVK